MLCEAKATHGVVMESNKEREAGFTKKYLNALFFQNN